MCIIVSALLYVIVHAQPWIKLNRARTNGYAMWNERERGSRHHIIAVNKMRMRFWTIASSSYRTPYSVDMLNRKAATHSVSVCPFRKFIELNMIKNSFCCLLFCVIWYENKLGRFSWQSILVVWTRFHFLSLSLAHSHTLGHCWFFIILFDIYFNCGISVFNLLLFILFNTHSKYYGVTIEKWCHWYLHSLSIFLCWIWISFSSYEPNERCCFVNDDGKKRIEFKTNFELNGRV